MKVIAEQTTGIINELLETQILAEQNYTCEHESSWRYEISDDEKII